MICENYDNLTTVEKVIFIGKLQHAVMSKNEYFDLAKKLIALGEMTGIFNDVEILPEREGMGALAD